MSIAQLAEDAAFQSIYGCTKSQFYDRLAKLASRMADSLDSVINGQFDRQAYIYVVDEYRDLVTPKEKKRK